MKYFFLMLMGMFIHVSSSAFTSPGTKHASVNKKSGKPNVIIVLTDDQGYGDFSCHGNPVLKTPALDKLYNESIRFDNFHVSPLCTPTRGQLMSGLDALHNKAATVGAGRGIMRRDIITMPEVFRQNGYQTGIFGKWHLGENYPDRPIDRGFQKSVWIKGWGILSETEFDNDYYKTRYIEDDEIKYSEKYCTDLWFDEGMKWMGEMCDKNQPFFTYLALNAPHGPFHSPKEGFDLYRGQVDNNSTASFLGMIHNIDQNMAKLEKWLVERNIKENTIVVFMNDNGGTGGVKLYNAGMRGEKGSLYDGGHRAACFFRWPGGGLGVPRTVNDAAQVQDLLPTFIDLLKFKMKKVQQFDGVSLQPALKQQKKLKDRMFVVQYGEVVHYGEQKRPEKYFSCVVWNSWRLVGDSELYNIEQDPAQQHNVLADYPQIYTKMKAFYENWWIKAEPDSSKLIPLVIGSDKENPVILNSNDWSEGYINTQWAVAQASGSPTGGIWHVYAEKRGKYQLELSRWPFHLNRELSVIGPDKTVGGTKIRPGKAIPIAAGCVSLNGNNPVIVKRAANDTSISVNLDIEKGENVLQAWFRDKNGADLCGAYFVRVKKTD